MKQFLKSLNLFLLIFGAFELAHARNYCANAAEKKCLADTINGEARNQGYEGMIIVAKAVMTRFARGYNGRTICKITDGASFHRDGKRPTKGGPIDTRANENIALATEAGCKMGDMGITHFYRIGSKKPNWADDFPPARPSSHGAHYLFNAPMYVKADLPEQYELFPQEFDVAEIPQEDTPLTPDAPVAM